MYDVAPVAFSVTLCPAHTDGLFTVTVGFGFTVTVDVAVDEQVPVVPVTV